MPGDAGHTVSHSDSAHHGRSVDVAHPLHPHHRQQTELHSRLPVQDVSPGSNAWREVYGQNVLRARVPQLDTRLTSIKQATVDLSPAELKKLQLQIPELEESCFKIIERVSGQPIRDLAQAKAVVSNLGAAKISRLSSEDCQEIKDLSRVVNTGIASVSEQLQARKLPDSAHDCSPIWQQAREAVVKAQNSCAGLGQLNGEESTGVAVIALETAAFVDVLDKSAFELGKNEHLGYTPEEWQAMKAANAKRQAELETALEAERQMAIVVKPFKEKRQAIDEHYQLALAIRKMLGLIESTHNSVDPHKLDQGDEIHFGLAMTIQALGGQPRIPVVLPPQRAQDIDFQRVGQLAKLLHEQAEKLQTVLNDPQKIEHLKDIEENTPCLTPHLKTEMQQLRYMLMDERKTIGQLAQYTAQCDPANWRELRRRMDCEHFAGETYRLEWCADAVLSPGQFLDAIIKQGPDADRNNVWDWDHYKTKNYLLQPPPEERPQHRVKH